MNISKLSKYRLEIALYALLCVVLWLVPVFNVLHVESCAVIAGVGFFLAGLSVLRRNNIAPQSLTQHLSLQLGLLLVPFALMNLSMLWIPNCDFLHGWLFFALFPIISVLFSTSLAFLILISGISKKKTLFIFLGFVIGLGGVLYDLGFHPQFYTYNPVFGGVLGPIYDEELAIRSGLFWAKGVEMLWAFVFGIWACKMQRKAEGKLDMKYMNLQLGGLTILIGMAYLYSGKLGINTPEWKIEEQLGSVVRTKHFDIYYDKNATTPHEAEELGRAHEFRYAQLCAALGFDVPKRILSFVYPDAATRADLTGARRTSVAPLWLKQPQIHLEFGTYENVMPHEMAHVFSRQIGISGTNSSAYIGLVEGFAVALEPADGLPSPHQQVASALKNGMDRRMILAIADKLSPRGFWGGRGAVSYTTMGSFMRFLMDRYGMERMKRVYAWANFEEIYGKSVENLAQEWTNFLKTVAIDEAQQSYTRASFGRLSLFEQRCPHYIPPFVYDFRQAHQALAQKDTVQALSLLKRVFQAKSNLEEAGQLWGDIQLARSQEKAVVTALMKLSDKSPKTWRLLADAKALQGDSAVARVWYDSALVQLSPFAHESRLYLAMRKSLTAHPQALRVLLSTSTPKRKNILLEKMDFTSKEKTYFQAELEAEQGDFARSFERLSKIKDENADEDADVDFEIARFAYSARKYSDALRYIDQAQQKRPNSIWQAYLEDWKARNIWSISNPADSFLRK
jgi:tetratricopeptide (TPR) repeat protein